jgi:uncharacterized protein (UPF0297 family)
LITKEIKEYRNINITNNRYYLKQHCRRNCREYVEKMNCDRILKSVVKYYLTPVERWKGSVVEY